MGNSPLDLLTCERVWSPLLSQGKCPENEVDLEEPGEREMGEGTQYVPLYSSMGKNVPTFGQHLSQG
jgi:hypothetical protein